MAALDELINQISDEVLRDRIRTELKRANKQKKFGLVFEQHLPEATPLYDVPVKKGSAVALKGKSITDIYLVETIDGDNAICIQRSTKDRIVFPVNDLVSVAQFGEAIYPYLQPLDSICNAPDSDLWHTLIEADNYHALQLLEYLYAGKVDCIYIDPPYNTGARDWKYNNDYVDSADGYRHSKWLSMMEKRLKLAKKLLCADGVMIVAIDDYEQCRLVQLLEEIFPNYEVDTVIVNHHPQGGAADNISRTHEYALFVVPKGLKLIKGKKEENVEERWSLTRGGTDVRNMRKGRPNSFYAIYVNKSTREVVGVGPHLDIDTPYDRNEAPEGCVAFYPVGRDGKERVWRYERESMMQHISEGDIVCTESMTLNVVKRREVKYDPVFSVWTDGRYNAGTYGTSMLQSLFGGETRFSYPKSLYTVLDCVHFSTIDKPNALIVDFFAGSGTTLHAVNLLNAFDNGKRRCILVTNNEVSEDEGKRLLKQGIQPGTDNWDAWGVARHITWPRTVYSIKGYDVNGESLKGEYIGGDPAHPRAIADGFTANAKFFKLGFLDKTAVSLGRKCKELLPLLWMKAGARGPCPSLEGDEIPPMMILPENHMAILSEEWMFEEFAEKVNGDRSINTVFLITDSETSYKEMVRGLKKKETHQLYREYLDNFRINQGGRRS